MQAVNCFWALDGHCTVRHCASETLDAGSSGADTNKRHVHCAYEILTCIACRRASASLEYWSTASGRPNEQTRGPCCRFVVQAEGPVLLVGSRRTPFSMRTPCFTSRRIRCVAATVVSVVFRPSGLWSLCFRRAHNRLNREEGACLSPLGFVGPYLQVAKQLPKEARINPSTSSAYALAAQTSDSWLLGSYITTRDCAMGHPCSPSLSQASPPLPRTDINDYALPAIPSPTPRYTPSLRREGSAKVAETCTVCEDTSTTAITPRIL